MSRRVHRSSSQTIVDEPSKEIPEPQGLLDRAVQYGKSWCPLLARRVKLVAGQAVCDAVGICAARGFAALNLCPSALMPLWVKRCFSHYRDVAVGIRKIIQAPLDWHTDRDSLWSMLVGSGFLGPVQEELERTAVLHLVKKFFTNPDSKTAKATAIVASSLIFAMSHYHFAVTSDFQKMAAYQNIPAVHKEINSAFRAFQLVYDQQMVASFFSALSYGVAYEVTGSVLGPIALHAASNMALYALGLHTMPSPQNVQKMVEESIAVLRKYSKYL